MIADMQATEGLKGRLGEAERIYAASQWQLMWRKFRAHKLAVGATAVLGAMYLLAAFAQFVSPYDPNERSGYIYASPTKVHFVHEGKFRVWPFVYGIESDVDRETYTRIYIEDTSQIYPLHLFVRGFEYKLWGLIPLDRHLFGTPGGSIFLLGTDMMGRDTFSRIIYGGQISLSIGLVGVAISFVLGCIIGGVSGYYGGLVDNLIQRLIEFITSIPTIPLWMALSAALPARMDQLKVYLLITVILALRGWCGLARQVRGKLLQLREEDFVMAAKLAGASDWRVITRHLLPGFLSVLIVRITMAIPGMILGETALSFLGLGLRPPTVSWGVLLQGAQNVSAVVAHSWLLFPAVPVIVTVLAFNFVGDGLRDAADPYSQ